MNWWYAVNRRIASSGPGAKLFSHLAHRLDGPSLRWSNGRFAPGAFLTGVPLITLTTTGVKSGQPRSVPLLGTPDGENLILIASNWGGKKHPAWYYNLKANPQVQVIRKGQLQVFIAQEVSGAEYTRCWQRAVAIYPGYELYKSRTDGRAIPVLLLTPLS